LGAGDLAGLLTTVAQLVDEGHDLRRFTLDLVAQLRDLLVLQAAPEHPELVDATREHRVVLVEQAGRLPRERVLHALETLAATVVEQRQGTPRLPLELALAQLVMPRSPAAAVSTPAPAPAPVAPAPAPVAPTPIAAVPTPAPEPEPEPAAVSVPVPEPEPEPTTPPAHEPAPASAPEPSPAPAPAPTPEPAPAPEPVPDPDSAAAPVARSAVTLETVVERWDAVVELVRQASPRAKAIFEPAVPIRLVDGILTLSYGPRYSSFHAEQAERDDMRTMLRDALQRACSLDARVNVVRDGEDQRSRPTPPLVTDPDGPSREVLAREAADVAEADAGAAAPPDPTDVGALLAQRLDARPEP